MPETLSVAVCISDEVTLSDFVTPMEILASMAAADHPVIGVGLGEVPYRVEIDYLAPTMDPVVSIQGRNAPKFHPTLTYTDALASGKQFDILWVPAGKSGFPRDSFQGAIYLSNAGPLPDFATGENRVPKEEMDFITQQAPKAKYVMSVCTGAVQLAFAGILSGKRATTNKAFYRLLVVG